MLAVTRTATDQIGAALPGLRDSSPLVEVHARLRRYLSAEAATSQLAQALVCGRLAGHLAGSPFQRGPGPAWLTAQAEPSLAPFFQAAFDPQRATWLAAGLDVTAWDDACLRWCRAAPEGSRSACTLHRFDFFESFLSNLAARDRTRRGVYFTPVALARFVVESVDRCLRTEFDLRSGLASCQSWRSVLGPAAPHRLGSRAGDLPFVRVLDPACGTGVFLRAVLERIHATCVADWRRDGIDTAGRQTAWNDYVAERLLPRLAGVEWMFPAAVVAHIGLACQLDQTGFDFQRDARIQIGVGNSLAGPDPDAAVAHSGASEEDESGSWSSAGPFTVVVGNPPWAALSTNRNRWTDDLLHGRVEGAPANYFAVDGRRLTERKLWLHDDYVKFIRLAHCKIEQATTGVVALVTNHGYLENATFRGMRQALSATFPRISFLDLHGNRKSRERAPHGTTDQNLFGIDQGIAVGLFRRLPRSQVEPAVGYSELWGSREDKLARLTDVAWSDLPTRGIALHPPFYFFTPRKGPPRHLRERSFRLPDIMPLHSTAPITARDGFVVALADEELEARLRDFRDLAIPDTAIRSRYFGNSRSTRYAPGDTRGWKLPQARKCLAADDQWRGRIQGCCYRPFDRRRIYWSESMVDWPRTGVMRHLVGGDNLALITRRQMLPSQPCNFFWVTDGIVLDGVIRSDNRGSESVFPLWINSFDEGGTTVTARTLNFDAAFLAAIERATGLPMLDSDRSPEHTLQTGRGLLGYLYGLFHASDYRNRYASSLCIDFPPVLVPASAQIYGQLSQLGTRLIGYHTGQRMSARGATEQPVRLRWSFVGDAPVVASRFPRWSQGRVHVSPDAWCDGVPQQAWELCIGSYQPGRKWLRDRRGKRLCGADRDAYQGLVRGAVGTLQTVSEIDRVIERTGGWSGAFQATSGRPVARLGGAP